METINCFLGVNWQQKLESAHLRLAAAVGKVTLKSNGDEVLSGEFILQSNGDKALKIMFFHKK